MLALVASPDAIHTKSKTAEGLQSASSERFERFAAPAAVILCNIHACSSHPWCPQWQLRVVIAFASSQWVEQYFFPAGAIHVQAICAHLVGAFDMVSSSRPSTFGAPRRTRQTCQVSPPLSRSGRILLSLRKLWHADFAPPRGFLARHSGAEFQNLRIWVRVPNHASVEASKSP
jgi:hypothetical protein